MLNIINSTPDVVDAFKAAAEATGNEYMVGEIMIEPSKSKEKGESRTDWSLNTKRGKIYHAIIQKWLKKYKYTFEEFQDVLLYTFDEKIPLNQITFNIKD